MTAPRETRPAAREQALTPARWKEIKEILADALERSPDERRPFLDAACGDDDLLRGEVESLLAAATKDERFLETPAVVSAGLAASGEGNRSGLLARLSSALAGSHALLRELGGGGMARLFVAQEHALDRPVVIKVLSPELAHEMSVERFAREVRLAGGMAQANIIPVLSAGQIDGLPYYIMLYMGQTSLRDLCARKEKLPIAEALGVLRDVAKALAYAHGRGVVHRDVKPENVLLSSGTAMVTDFGIAKAISESRTDSDRTSTQPGMTWGTPAYMSPEQALGEPDLDCRTDVYSFGVVAYELLTGTHPFAHQQSAVQLVSAHLNETPRALTEVRPDLSPRIARLVMRCLAKDRNQRFDNGSHLLLALDALDSASLEVHATEPIVPSIAVLPFANHSGNAADEYFSDGITDEVINTLTRIPGLRVAARSSSFVFKKTSMDLRAVAEQLGVKTVLEGSVRQMGSRVRIAVQLVNASDGLVLWSERYERELADIFAIQDEIAYAIASALERMFAAGSFRMPALVHSSRERRVNPEAFELYLRGRHLVEQRSEGMIDALGCFEQSIRIDPHFSPAHAGIGYTFALFGIYHAMRPREAFPRAREAADRALALDPTDALALVVRAAVALWFEWDRKGAESLARRALELAPGLYLAHDCLGWVLAAQGRFEESIAAMQRGRTFDPLSDYATYDLGWVLMLAGRWEQAIREMRPAVERHPRSSELRRVYAYALFHSGRLEEASAELRVVLELNPGDRWGPANLAQVLAAMGDMDAARRLVREIEERTPHEPLPPVGLAIAHHWLGDDESALGWLAKAIDARDYWLVMLRYDPSMRRLRGDPPFEALIAQI